VLAVASTLKMVFGVLNLNGVGLNDGELCDLLAEAPVNAIVLIEDIDCAFVERAGAEDKANKLTFSGLLNAIDGVAASEGRILFATTNHLERLDPALVRPGRIDRKFEIGHADRDQARRLFARFFPDSDAALADQFAAAIAQESLPMSSLQSHLLHYGDDPAAAARRAGELARGDAPHVWPASPQRPAPERNAIFWDARL
jgi:chaperone BCS1